jgi:hypothetical protein
MQLRSTGVSGCRRVSWRRMKLQKASSGVSCTFGDLAHGPPLDRPSNRLTTKSAESKLSRYKGAE